MNNKLILDACCGSRMMWFDKKNPHAVFCDIRNEEHILCDGRTLVIDPDVIADVTDLPFENDHFSLVVFDPPHLTRAGENGWQRKKYGVLPADWRTFLRNGFDECMRVLKPNGTLVFKWSDFQVPFGDVQKVLPMKPMFGDQRGKTRWVVFMKIEEATNEV